MDRAECRRKMRNFLGHKFWRALLRHDVGRDEEVIRAYIRNQELGRSANWSSLSEDSAAQNPSMSKISLKPPLAVPINPTLAGVLLANPAAQAEHSTRTASAYQRIASEGR